jgi:choice-of-anchor C domain-containing protein
MNKFLASGAFAAAIIAGASISLGAAQAASVVNGSFEDGLTDVGTFTTINAGDSTSITGWTVLTGNVDYIGSYWTAADGSRSLDLNGLEPGSIAQTITGLTAGQQYKITFDLAGNPAGGPDPKTLQVTASAGSSAYSFDATNTSLTNMGWVQESFTFTADGISDQLIFASTTTDNSGNGTYPFAFGPALDNVSIATTPLPAALPLFAGGLGLIGLIGNRKRRKAQAAAGV